MEREEDSLQVRRKRLECYDDTQVSLDRDTGRGVYSAIGSDTRCAAAPRTGRSPRTGDTEYNNEVSGAGGLSVDDSPSADLYRCRPAAGCRRGRADLRAQPGQDRGEPEPNLPRSAALLGLSGPPWWWSYRSVA